MPHIAMQIDSIRTGTRPGNKRVLLLKQRAGEQNDRMMEEYSQDDFEKANVSK